VLSAATSGWKVPQWAALKPRPRGSAQDLALSGNRAVVKSANAEGQRYDLVMYGDSITATIRVKYQALWQNNFGHWRSASLGVGASTVEDLAARLMRGAERFAEDPRVVVVHIGIDNMKDSHPAEKLDYLLGWMSAAMPRSRIVVLALLPTKIPRWKEYNAEFEPIAAKHGATFSRCGEFLEIDNRAHFLDGVHPEEEGYRRIFRCLRPVIEQELRLNP
jgi:lysophospholipase L1-like esterase